MRAAADQVEPATNKYLVAAIAWAIPGAGHLLLRRGQKGVTFLIVSHEMGTLRRLCPRVSVMHEGQLIAEGSFEEVANHALVLEAYLGA